VNRRGYLRSLIAILLGALLAVPLTALGTPSVLGTVRGQRAAKVSLDGGKTWLPVGGLALPIVPGTELRTVGGIAVLELGGARIDVLPFTAVRLTEKRQTAEVALLYGRLAFRLPAQSRVEIVTALARLEPADKKQRVGEVFVNGADLLGLKMSEGSLQVRPVSEPRRPILASLAPVFLPKPPDTSDSLFTTDTLPAPPAAARAAFTPAGESIGYLDVGGRLIIHPGFTSDLTRPFSPKLVQMAAAGISEPHRRSDAVPLFDVNGGYLGYLAGPVFHAQLQADPPTTPPKPQEKDAGAPVPESAPSSGPSRRTLWTIAGVGAAVLVVGAGVAVGMGGGGGGGGGGNDAPAPPPPPPATP
jgi:hypothetical protein